jgi:hypothetical protein
VWLQKLQVNAHYLCKSSAARKGILSDCENSDSSEYKETNDEDSKNDSKPKATKTPKAAVTPENKKKQRSNHPRRHHPRQ